MDRRERESKRERQCLLFPIITFKYKLPKPSVISKTCQTAFPRSPWQYLCLPSGEGEYVFLETPHYIRTGFQMKLALFESSLVQMWALEQVLYVSVCILLRSAMKREKMLRIKVVRVRKLKGTSCCF